MSYKVKGTTVETIVLNESDTVKSVLQNIAMILGTKQGTVPMYREFGLPMEFIDKPIRAAQTLAIAEITEAIEKFEPRAVLRGITFEKADKTGELVPVVEVDIRDESYN